MTLRIRKPRHIRTRLALVFATTLTVLLGVYAVGTYVLLRTALYRELDRQLELEFHVGVEMMEAAQRSGTFPNPPPSRTVLPPEAPLGETWRWLEIWSPDGGLLMMEPGMTTAAHHLPDRPPRSEFGPESYRYADGQYVRVLSRLTVVLDTPVIIRALKPEAPIRNELWNYVRSLLVTLPLAVGLVGLVGYLLTKPALAPLVTLADRARLITADRLSDRLPVKNPDDEVGRLAAIFNETLSRLERSFDDLRRFTADASHELRTPLTALRSVGEVGLRDSKTPEEYREVIGSLLEEANRLSHLVDNLLALSRTDSGQVRPNPEAIDLESLCCEIRDLLAVLADEKHQVVELAPAGPAVAVADRQLVRRALINLVDNAIKYSPAGSTVKLITDTRDGTAIVEVVDEGPGIPAADRQRIFNRFYRVDPARHRATGGSGLGLSIAQSGVTACGGRIEVDDGPGGGSAFRILLPAENADRVAGVGAMSAS